MRHDSPSLIITVEQNPAEFRTFHTGNMIKLCQAFIEISIFTVDKIEDTAVPVDDLLDKQLSLAEHRHPQVFFKIRKSLAIGSDRFELPQFEPLPAKVLHQCTRFLIAQHAPDLSGENSRTPQGSLIGAEEKLIIRHTAPKEIRETRCKLVLVDRISQFSLLQWTVLFYPEKEMRRNEHCLNRLADSFLE